MIKRAFDATFLNSVCNHPEVRPWLAGSEPVIDLASAIANADNFALVAEGGGFLLMCHEPGIYEVHSQFFPEAKGTAAQAMREGMDYMFCRTDCERIVTQVPDNNQAAAALAKLGGFRSMFRREDTPRGPTAYMGVNVEEWAQGNAELEADGEWFHQRITEAVKTARPDLPDHPEDKSHDRTVGAAVRMIRAGNVLKGVAFYNRWARLAGYTPVRPITVIPPVFDVSEPGLECVVGLKGEEMEILLCR